MAKKSIDRIASCKQKTKRHHKARKRNLNGNSTAQSTKKTQSKKQKQKAKQSQITSMTKDKYLKDVILLKMHFESPTEVTAHT